MHSSRMRTGRSLTVCSSLLPGGVCSRGVSALGGGGSAPGGICSQGVSAPRGSPCPGGVLPAEEEGFLPAWGVSLPGGLLPGEGGLLLGGFSPPGGRVLPARGVPPCLGGSP